MSNRRKTRKRPSAPHAQLKTGVYVLNIQHDDSCPTLRTQRQFDCTCSEVGQRLVDAETYVRQLKKGGGA